MRPAGGMDARLVAVGGGTQGGLWLQIVSDVLQQQQQMPRHTIGACYGDALLAGIGAGLATPDASWNPIVHVVEPKVDAGADYERLYRLYHDLYPATRDLAHTLAGIGEGPTLNRERPVARLIRHEDGQRWAPNVAIGWS